MHRFAATTNVCHAARRMRVIKGYARQREDVSNVYRTTTATMQTASRIYVLNAMPSTVWVRALRGDAWAKVCLHRVPVPSAGLNPQRSSM